MSGNSFIKGSLSALGCVGEPSWHWMLHMGFTSQPGCGSLTKCSVSLMYPTTELRKHSLETAAPDGKISMLRTGGESWALGITQGKLHKRKHTHKGAADMKAFVLIWLIHIWQNILEQNDPQTGTRYLRQQLWKTYNRHTLKQKCLLTKVSTVNLEDSQVLLITRSEPHLEGVLGPGAGSAVPTGLAVKDHLLVWAHREAKRQTREWGGTGDGGAEWKTQKEQLRTGPKSHSSFPVS